jgi:hypothetical protein
VAFRATWEVGELGLAAATKVVLALGIKARLDARCVECEPAGSAHLGAVLTEVLDWLHFAAEGALLERPQVHLELIDALLFRGAQ